MYRGIVLKIWLDRCINKDNNDILFLLFQQFSFSRPPYHISFILFIVLEIIGVNR